MGWQYELSTDHRNPAIFPCNSRIESSALRHSQPNGRKWLPTRSLSLAKTIPRDRDDDVEETAISRSNSHLRFTLRASSRKTVSVMKMPSTIKAGDRKLSVGFRIPSTANTMIIAAHRNAVDIGKLGTSGKNFGHHRPVSLDGSAHHAQYYRGSCCKFLDPAPRPKTNETQDRARCQ